MKRTLNMLIVLAVLAMTFSFYGATPAIAAEFVDQDHSTLQAIPSSYSLIFFNPQVQSFIPTADNLVAVDLYVGVLAVAPGSMQVSIRDGSASGTVLASAVANVTTEGWAHVNFGSAISLTPGTTYFLRADHISGNILLSRSNTSFGDTGYASGSLWACNPTCAAQLNEDLFFRTYYGTPEVQPSSTLVDFGGMPVGQAHPGARVDVTNSGDADLHIGTLNVTGADFSIANDTCSNTTVAAGDYCYFDAVFQPLSLGPKTGEISIPSDAATTPDSVSLYGAGIIPLSTTFTSLGTYDGTIFETNELSGVGGTPNISGGFLDIGDMVLDRQVLALTHFDTSSLPDDAVITGLTLQLKRYQFVGTDPFTLLGNLNVDIASPYFGAEMALRAGDFQASPSQDNVGIFNPTPLTGNWYESNLGASAFPYLNLTGATQFRLHFTLDDNDDLQNDFIRFFSGNAPIAGYRPVLIVEYYVPDICAPIQATVTDSCLPVNP